jgi:hypothetical protein
MNIDDFMTQQPKKPNKIKQLKALHTGTEWMFSQQKAEIIKACMFGVPAQNVRTPRDLIVLATERYVKPMLTSGEDFYPVVVAKIDNQLMIVNWQKYQLVQQERAMDTLLAVMMKNKATMIGFVALNPLESLVSIMVADVKADDMLSRTLKVEWKVGMQGKVADRFMEQSLPDDKVGEFFAMFGMGLEADPFANIK